jgi:hypothetical protein
MQIEPAIALPLQRLSCFHGAACSAAWEGRRAGAGVLHRYFVVGLRLLVNRYRRRQLACG